ncbi:MAG: LysR family transcriptional regulator [Pirellulales bacterium]|nr:LysR family transcriptional regulator [Pirellulales bacterium]
MHLRFLKIFCDIVDLHSFSQAAKLNGVSQSNASQVVHTLEQQMGVELIDRSKRPFVLTAEGARFQEGARVIVQRYDDLVHEIREMHDSSAGRLTIAAIYSVGMAHMSICTREFLALSPKAHVRLEYLHPDRVYEVVDQGHADLGLVSYPEESHSLVSLPWRSEPFVVACHPHHAFSKQRTVTLEQLNHEPYVAFQSGLKIREEIDRTLAQHKARVRVAQEFDNIESIKRAIEIGTGISLLPEPTLAREIETGSLAQLRLEGVVLERPLGIIHRRDRKLSEAACRFIQLLQSQAQPQLSGTIAAQASVVADGVKPFVLNGHTNQSFEEAATLR